MMNITTTIVAPDQPRRKPRPSVSENPAVRLKHIQCAALLLSGVSSPEAIANLFGVSRRTAYYWRDRALGYDDPEAEGLRRLMTRNN